MPTAERRLAQPRQPLRRGARVRVGPLGAATEAAAHVQGVQGGPPLLRENRAAPPKCVHPV